MLQLAQDPDADALLDRDPLALLIGMLLDQQFPMERAFAGPAGLARRLGVDRLDARALAEYDPEALAALFTGPPALHRYPAAMAGRDRATDADLWPLVLAVPTREQQSLARETLRDVLAQSENAALPAAAEEASL